MVFSKRVLALFKLDLRFSVLLWALAVMASGAVAQTPEQPASAAAAASLSDAFAAAAKKVEPAVVSIDTKSRPAETARRRGTPNESDDILEFLGRQFPPRPQAAIGSGFIVDKAGYIVTNRHVIETAMKIMVKLDSGEEYPATLVGEDVATDLAVLKIDAGKDLPFVKFGSSEKARVGDWVLALGSPFGLNRTVTAGIISQVQRETPQASPFQRFIQTDAAVNRGNSGGPLVNLNGEVIGVNSQIATTTGDYNGISFALPSDMAASVYEQIRTTGKVRRGFLGVGLDTVREEFAKVYGMGSERGAILTRFANEGGPAKTAGLLPGDVIVAFNGQPIADTKDLIAKVSAVSPDSPATITYLREVAGKMERKTVPLVLAERKEERAEADPPRKLPLETAAEADKPFGLTVAEVPADIATALKITGPKGVLVKEINPESFIADVKLATGDEALGQGDIIQRVNRVSVANTAEFLAAVGKLKKGDAVVLHVLSPQPGREPTALKIVQFTVQ